MTTTTENNNTITTNNNDNNKSTLRRSLTLPDIILYGVGCSVGAGIYSLVGIGASVAGPAVTLSFILCGIACVFTSLSYAEFASRIPVAGSAYTYAQVSFGEVWGWAVGWNLTLGYGVSSAVVARSWAEYLADLVGWAWLGEVTIGGTDCSPCSMVIVGLCTMVLVSGAKESTRFNSIVTMINLAVLAFVLIAGMSYGTVEKDNLVPFMPHGMSGVASAAGLVFFAYLGFDMVACLSEEVENPQVNMPLGIVGSLVISMTIYVSVSFFIVGMAPIDLLGIDVPVSNALLINACCTHEEQLSSDAAQQCLSTSCQPILYRTLFYGSRLVELGAVFGLTTATFTGLMGQPRIFYKMAQDGLLFDIFGQVNPKTQVPTAGTIITGVFVAIVACLVDLEDLANMISLGTLQVFTFVNAGVIVLRFREGDGQVQEGEVVKEALMEGMQLELQPLPHRDQDDVRTKDTAETFNRKPLLEKFLDTAKYNDIAAAQKPIYLTLIFTISILLTSLSISNRIYDIVIPIISTSFTILSTYLLFTLRQSSSPNMEETFQCPCVPFVPLLGIACNSYMMGSMPIVSWMSILLWLSCGFIFYYAFRSFKKKKANLKMSRKTSELFLFDESTPLTVQMTDERSDSCESVPSMSSC